MKSLEATKPIHTPVLIVGGGLTGLSAALFLLRQGIKPILVERHESAAAQPKIKKLDVRSMELMRELGLSLDITTAGSNLKPEPVVLSNRTLAQAMTRKSAARNRKPVYSPEDVAGISPENGVQATQDTLEQILLNAAVSRGASIFFYTEWLSLRQDDKGIAAVLKNRANSQEVIVYADYLIAADGAKSPVRTFLQVETESRETLGNLLNIYFDADLQSVVREQDFGLLRINNLGLSGTLLPVDNRNRWQFQMHYDAVSEKPEDFDLHHITSILKGVIGLPDLKLKIHKVVPQQPALIFVKRMRQGRVFFAGEAAHAIADVEGRSVNVGIQDAHNLAWKLAAAIKNKADEKLLQTYHAERWPVGRYFVKQAGRKLDQFGVVKKPGVKNKIPLHAHTLMVQTGLDKLFPGMKRRQFSNHFGLPDYQYFSSAVMSEDKTRRQFVRTDSLNARPGTRMPHFWVTHQGEKLSTLDFLGTDLVLFTGRKNALWQWMAGMTEKQSGLHIPVYSIGKTEPLSATSTTVQKALGISDSGAVLVRPDGFVAWRSDRDNAADLISFGTSLKQILGWPAETGKFALPLSLPPALKAG
ncbi:MAG TPA: FAD-dependent oxidoreductase [Edaphocola sp.]|nr:FAD-dependent oxidoreductase [Edaphocola sp.]